MADMLKDTCLLSKAPAVSQGDSGGTVTVTGEAVLKGRVVGLFFSAAWCPPCQHFLPVLTQLYQELLDRHQPFQVVFVSMDKNSDEMMNYYMHKQPAWLALQYADPLKEVLTEKYEVSLIPKLVVVTEAGEVISSKGRKDVQDKGVVAFRGWQAAMLAAAKKADQQQLLLQQFEVDKECTEGDSSSDLD